MAGYNKIVAHSFGDPDVLEIEHCDQLPEPGLGEVRIRVEAAGVGYTDTILRRGRYMLYKGGLPLTPGYDMAGVIDKLGPGVMGLAVGDRVADMPVHGAYSQYLLGAVGDLIPVPAGVGPVTAVEVPLMGVTAWQMLTRLVSLPQGASILVVGASGAVGRLLVQLGRQLGLKIIGTSSTAKLELVERLGATAVAYHRVDLREAILAANDGCGVAAAFDAIGGASWATSWAVLAPGGTLVGYGMQDFLESGAAAVEAARSRQRFNTTWNEEGASDGTNRHTIFYDINERRQALPDQYRADAQHLLELIAQGSFVPPPAEVLRLDQAAEAHRRVAAGDLSQRLVIRP